MKVWLEDAKEGDAQTAWRGRITHVPSGENRYVTDLGEISSFIATYLRQMGAQVECGRELRRWLRWLNQRLPRVSSTKKDDE